MPSGVVCFDAVLGNFPSQLVIDGLFEHIEAQIYNFKWKYSYLSLCTPIPPQLSQWYPSKVIPEVILR